MKEEILKAYQLVLEAYQKLQNYRKAEMETRWDDTSLDDQKGTDRKTEIRPRLGNLCQKEPAILNERMTNLNIILIREY